MSIPEVTGRPDEDVQALRRHGRHRIFHSHSQGTRLGGGVLYFDPDGGQESRVVSSMCFEVIKRAQGKDRNEP